VVRTATEAGRVIKNDSSAILRSGQRFVVRAAEAELPGIRGHPAIKNDSIATLRSVQAKVAA